MKVKITIESNPLCLIDVEMDYNKAIQAWEGMWPKAFEEFFAFSMLDSIRKASDTDEWAKEIYSIIQMYSEIEWHKFIWEDTTKDTQENFDKFFTELLTSKIAFTPLP